VKPRLLVTGASGFLGWNLCREALPAWDVVGVVHQGDAVPPGVAVVRADLRLPGDLSRLLDEAAPDAVVHLAAIADAGLCQRDPGGSFPLNVGAPVHLARLCAERDLLLAFASTDLVFAGTAAPYTETDTPDPVCLYGRQKALAERLVLAAYCGALVCRLPLLFGEPSPRSGSFLSGMLRELRAGRPVRLFTDEFRTPAAATCVARGLLGLLGNTHGICHLGGPERLSRFAFGELVAARFNLDLALLLPTRQADLTLACPRPPDVSLDSARARRFGYAPLPPAEALMALKAPDMVTGSFVVQALAWYFLDRA